MGFAGMGLRKELLDAISDSGYTDPTPIQERAIPEALAGRDLMCCAQTGTGKTAAFALPILHRIAEGLDSNQDKPILQALILVPTRELAIQVSKNVSDYAKYLGLTNAMVCGGLPVEPQEMMLRHGVSVLVATPGRLIDHMWRGNIDYRDTQYLVLDEADRMLDMGFIDDVRSITQEIPRSRQSMLFSATLDRAIQKLSKDLLQDPVRIEVAPPASTAELIRQYRINCTRHQKKSTLEKFLYDENVERAIVFTRTKAGATQLTGQLRQKGLKAAAFHSDRSQADRTRTMGAFREGKVHVLVATDIAARGIDIDDITHIVNFDMPHTAEDYVHRIGRTARAGRAGVAVSFVTPEDAGSLRTVERLISMKIPVWGEEDHADEHPPEEESRSGGGRHRSRKTAKHSRRGRTEAESRARKRHEGDSSDDRDSRDGQRGESRRAGRRDDNRRRDDRGDQDSARSREGDAPSRSSRRRRGGRSRDRDRDRTQRDRTSHDHDSAHAERSSKRTPRRRAVGAKKEPSGGVIQSIVKRVKSGLFSRGKKSGR